MLHPSSRCNPNKGALFWSVDLEFIVAGPIQNKRMPIPSNSWRSDPMEVSKREAIECLSTGLVKHGC